MTRARLALEGSLSFALGGDAVPTPSLELGARHDGGDAETGFGTDIGAGLALSSPSRGLSAEIRARGLLSHEADGLGQQGLSGTLSFDPSPGSDRGLSLSLAQTMGEPSGGADALFERTTLAGLGAEDEDPTQRFEARLGYGFALFGDPAIHWHRRFSLRAVMRAARPHGWPDQAPDCDPGEVRPWRRRGDGAGESPSMRRLRRAPVRRRPPGDTGAHSGRSAVSRALLAASGKVFTRYIGQQC